MIIPSTDEPKELIYESKQPAAYQLHRAARRATRLSIGAGVTLLCVLLVAVPGSVSAQTDATTVLVSVNREGTGTANNQSRLPRLSANGRYVTFSSTATNLTDVADTNNAEDVFVRDLHTGVTQLVSINRAGTASGNRASFILLMPPEISADGHCVLFASTATDLVENDTSGSTGNIYVRDLHRGVTELVSVNREGTNGGNGVSAIAGLSADARVVLFWGVASDICTDRRSGNLAPPGRAGDDSRTCR